MDLIFLWFLCVVVSIRLIWFCSRTTIANLRFTKHTFIPPVNMALKYGERAHNTTLCAGTLLTFFSTSLTTNTTLWKSGLLKAHIISLLLLFFLWLAVVSDPAESAVFPIVWEQCSLSVIHSNISIHHLQICCLWIYSKQCKLYFTTIQSFSGLLERRDLSHTEAAVKGNKSNFFWPSSPTNTQLSQTKIAPKKILWSWPIPRFCLWVHQSIICIWELNSR